MVPAYLQHSKQDLLAQKRAKRCTSCTISTHHTSNHQYFKPPTTENPLFICPPFQPLTLQDRYIYIYACLGRKKKHEPLSLYMVGSLENSSLWDVDSHAKKLTHTRKFPHRFSSVILPPLHICSSTITIQVKTELVEVLCGSHWFHPTSPNISLWCLWKRCDHPFHISHPPLPMPPF